MSKQYDNELRGALFKNKDKVEGDKKPEYTGNATIDGVEYFMDAWLNVAESGKKYMSVKFKPKQWRHENPPAREPVGGRGAQGRVYQTRDDDDGPPW